MAQDNSAKLSEVREQVTRLLGSSQQGEIGDLKSFLEEFALKDLTEERKSYDLGPEDDSDDDDYPDGHFKESPNGKKPLLRSERLKEHQRKALRDFRDGNGRSALHFAASSNAPGCGAVAEFILSLLPDAHALVDDNGATPIILAANVSGRGVAEKMVRLLLLAGADAAASDKDSVQAMHHAAAGGREQVVRLLHSSGAPLDVSSGAGTPLHWAAGEGKAVAVEMLVGLGAAVDAPNAQGLTPIIMAAARGSGSCVASLARRGADVGLLLGGGLTVLHVCADTGLTEAVEALLAVPKGKECATRPDDGGKLPIHLAAAAGFEATVKALHPASFPSLQEEGGGSGASGVEAAPRPPSVIELMEQGRKDADATELEASSAAAREEAAGLATSSALIENTLPAATPEDASAAQAAKDRGNACFSSKDHQGAAAAYTEAILLDGSDAVFFSNRSAAWLELANSGKADNANSGKDGGGGAGGKEGERLKQRALADAEQCRRLKPDWAKACYRMAAARMACNLFEDAAVSAFEGLKLDDTNAALKKIMKEAVAKGREEHFK